MRSSKITVYLKNLQSSEYSFKRITIFFLRLKKKRKYVIDFSTTLKSLLSKTKPRTKSRTGEFYSTLLTYFYTRIHIFSSPIQLYILINILYILHIYNISLYVYLLNFTSSLSFALKTRTD